MAGQRPDVALLEIDQRVLDRIGKQAFEVRSDVYPDFPVKYAAAIGFPTTAKAAASEPHAERLAMPCVRAVAEGTLSCEHSDQVQFYSEVAQRTEIVSLSGMSGGPVFWSDGERFGLLGFVKEALDVEPRAGEETIHTGPRVNFICQRFRYESFERWAAYVADEWPRRRAALNERVQEK